MTSTPDRKQTTTFNRLNQADIDPATPPEEMRFVVGHIVGVHGLRGEVKMTIVTDQPEFVPELQHVYFDDDPAPVPVASIRSHSRHALVKFDQVNTRNEAELLRGTIIRVSHAQLPPQQEDSYYHYQLLGLDVSTESGEPIGVIVEIIETGEVDVYVVRDTAGQVQMFPAIRDVVLEINPTERKMVVRPQEWEKPEETGGDRS